MVISWQSSDLKLLVLQLLSNAESGQYYQQIDITADGAITMTLPASQE